MWSQWDRLIACDGVLFGKWLNINGETIRYQMIVPEALVHEVFKHLHNGPAGGHLGILKTTEKGREQFYWYGMTKDVEVWCRQCVKCSGRKPTPTKPRTAMISSKAG